VYYDDVVFTQMWRGQEMDWLNKYSMDSLFVGSKSFLKSAFKYYDNADANAPAIIRICIQISIANHMKILIKSFYIAAQL